MSTQSKITKYPRGIPNNIGFIIFAVILVYLLICIVSYMGSKHVTGYEVKEGSLSLENVYQGIALRDETIVTSDGAGYVNYFATEGKRVAVGNLVYTIDSSGRLIDYLNAESADTPRLTSDDLGELRTQIVTYTEGFPRIILILYMISSSALTAPSRSSPTATYCRIFWLSMRANP